MGVNVGHKMGNRDSTGHHYKTGCKMNNKMGNKDSIDRHRHKMESNVGS